MAGTAESCGNRCRVGKGSDSSAAIVNRDSGGAPFELVDGDREGGAEHRGVFCNLGHQVEFFAARDGKGRAEHSTSVFEHEINLLGCYFFSSHNEVALVFAVFVVDHNHHFACFEISDCAFYRVKSDGFVAVFGCQVVVLSHCFRFYGWAGAGASSVEETASASFSNKSIRAEVACRVSPTFRTVSWNGNRFTFLITLRLRESER